LDTGVSPASVRPGGSIRTDDVVRSWARVRELLGNYRCIDSSTNSGGISRTTDSNPCTISGIQLNERVDLSVCIVVYTVVALLCECLATKRYRRDSDATCKSSHHAAVSMDCTAQSACRSCKDHFYQLLHIGYLTARFAIRLFFYSWLSAYEHRIDPDLLG
jgi:hypothetical protein